ncbi:hypothetical protein GCM10023321_77440 [Pseudonocardia eucalypti]|uniref:PIN domain-containing protein n=1 Tax=Pseudonocardia eucalypti TaxID=648755 RepID=A0ABP9RAN7_9PSEU|nr:putative nucleic acid-binding protein [Pseudonocardia eucalypti]
MPTPLVYDAGALVAADRGERSFRALHTQALAQERRIVVPTPVLTQVWRNGARQARVGQVLRGCVLDPVDEQFAKTAGVLLGESGTRDAVDAIVVALALRLGGVVVTTDPGDLHKLADRLVVISL